MSIERIPLVAGNWKMNGLRADAIALAKAVVDRVAGAPPCEMLMCPPATLLTEVGRVLAGSGIALGGQDCHAADGGAHTGDISARMLADAGCRYVILGHSERRAGYREGDDLVASKVAAAGHAGLTAIVCVGETEAERGGGNALAVVGAQIEGSLPADPSARNIVVAYEPVWAIGSGRTPSPDQVRQVHAHIRGRLTAVLGQAEAARTRILYGGSVKPANAAAMLALDDVDGALVGGASLDAEDFCAIARSCR